MGLLIDPLRQGDLRGSGPEFAHHGITVSDLGAATAFFVEVLGLTAAPRIDLDETFSAGVTGIDGVSISVVFVQGAGITVELLEYRGADGRAGGGVAGSRSCDAGAAHLALYVDDVADVVARAHDHGWRPLGALQPITVGPRAGGRAVYLGGPDGAIVELVQRPGSESWT